jgi:hypothetical protein
MRWTIYLFFRISITGYSNSSRTYWCYRRRSSLLAHYWYCYTSYQEDGFQSSVEWWTTLATSKRYAYCQGSRYACYQDAPCVGDSPRGPL